MQLAHALMLSQIVVDGCEVIEYRRGGPPWEAWQTMPRNPPEGYRVRGPWACLAGEQSVEGPCWLWARALDVDERAKEAQERAARIAEAEAKEAAFLEQCKPRLARLRDEARRLGYGDLSGVGPLLDNAALTGEQDKAKDGLSGMAMRDLRVLGRDRGVRSQYKDHLVRMVLNAYLDESLP